MSLAVPASAISLYTLSEPILRIARSITQVHGLHWVLWTRGTVVYVVYKKWSIVSKRSTTAFILFFTTLVVLAMISTYFVSLVAMLSLSITPILAAPPSSVEVS